MVEEDATSGQVVLSRGESASTHLHRILHSAALTHPDVFETVGIGSSPADFRTDYPELMPRFEAARADSATRCEIAASLVETARSVFAWRTDGTEVPLDAHLDRPAEPFHLESRSLAGPPGLVPRVPVGGTDLARERLVAHAHELVARGSASDSVADGIGWIVDQAGDDGLDLTGRRIVVVGAAAELAPTRLWLEGGAEVLWIDLAEPTVDLLESPTLSGRVSWVPGGADILTAPHRIRATIAEFAQGEAVDLGLYAYAPGRAREWRLTATMNAIVDSLPHDVVRSVAMLVSPTTCGELTPAELAGEEARRGSRARWLGLLDRLGLLGQGPGHARHGDTRTNRGIVSIQGASYQAAQYLGKAMAAEAWATSDPARHVSINTAGISRTESLRHPVFDTAFGGARAFGVETFDPATTAALNGLLTLRDRLDPTSPVHPDRDGSPTARARALGSTRVHGGIYQLPYPIAPTLRVATALGVVRDPRRIPALLRRR